MVVKKQDDSDILFSFDPSRCVKAQNGGLFVCAGGGRHSRRMIDSFELIIGRRGELFIQEQGREFVVSAGQTLLLWPGREHFGTKPYSDELSFYWLHFKLPKSVKTAKSVTVSQHKRLGEPERITSLVHRFLDEQQSTLKNQAVLDLLMTLILCEIARVPALGSDEGQVSKTASALAHRAMSFIATNYMREISSCDIAKNLQVSADHLGRVFRQIHNSTIVDTIHRYRLKNARKLLLETNLNIDEIAAEIGFASAGYLRRIFKRLEGLTPTQFRKIHSRQHINTW